MSIPGCFWFTAGKSCIITESLHCNYFRKNMSYFLLESGLVLRNYLQIFTRQSERYIFIQC